MKEANEDKAHRVNAVLQQYLKVVESSLKSFQALVGSFLACQPGGSKGYGRQIRKETGEVSGAALVVEPTPESETTLVVEEAPQPNMMGIVENPLLISPPSRDTPMVTEAAPVAEEEGLVEGVTRAVKAPSTEEALQRSESPEESQGAKATLVALEVANPQEGEALVTEVQGTPEVED